MPDISSLLTQARRALAQKSYKEAHSACMEILKQDSLQAEPLYLLGILTAEHANHTKAIELFDRAKAAGFHPSRCDAQAARSYLALNRREDAVTRAQLAMTEPSDDAFTLDTIGVVLSRTGHHEAAVEWYEKAVSAAPSNAGYHYNVGVAKQFLGLFDEARTAYQTCVSLDPTQSKARIALVSITRQTAEQNEISTLESIWLDTSARDAESALQIAHALAKSYEDLGDPPSAMSWLAMGKAVRKAAGLPDRREADKACFDAAEWLAGELTIETSADADGPIFITGMPRTGTTLTDRIVSGHSRVISAGELSDFSIALKRQAGSDGNLVLDPETLRSAANLDLHRVGKAYLNTVRNSLVPQGRFTDKMPLNVFFIPAILAAIPSARIVCLRRHPADTVLSNYRQLFATAYSYYTYAYDMEDTARYVVRFNRLLGRYQNTLPKNRFRVLDYESLVQNVEPETRAILNFCGLDFEPACVEFHKSTAPVATASASQVREPLYTSALDRWKRYRPALDPAITILKEAGLIPDDI